MRKLMLWAAALLLVAGSAYALEQVYSNSTVTYDDKLNGTDATNPNTSISASVADVVKAGFDQHVITAVKSAFNPGAVTGATPELTTVATTGAALGDLVIGCSSSIDLAGIDLYCYVSAADVVSIKFVNPDSDDAGINLGAMNVTVAVLPKSVFGL